MPAGLWHGHPGILQRGCPPWILCRGFNTVAPLPVEARLRAARHHFAIIAPPTPGHINPLQALGSELIGLGHRITFVHQSDVASLIGDPRIGFEPLATVSTGKNALSGYNAILAAPTGPAGLTRMIRATAMMSERLLDHAPAVLKRIGATALIADSAEPSGTLLAQRLGLPCVVSVTGLPLLEEADVPPPYLGWKYRPGAIGRFRNRGGYMVASRLMRPVTEVLERYRTAWNLERCNDARLYVAQCPKALDYPRRHLPPTFHYGSPWRMTSPQDVHLADDGRPLVFCSLGTLQGSRGKLFAIMSEACAAIGARAVIGHAGGLSVAEAAALPGDPLVRAFWPQDTVLRSCAAAVLHGGFNTVLDALAAEVPIVALPIAFEQPGTAARLTWLGAGEVLSPSRLSVRHLAANLNRVLTDPSYRRAASRLSAEMKTAGGAAGAAARIDEAFG
jgi:MGT family glycosyltransferase